MIFLDYDVTTDCCGLLHSESLLWLVYYANSSHLSKCYYQLLLIDLASVSGQAPPICTHYIYTCNLSRTLGFFIQIRSWCNCSVDDQRINHKIYLYIFWRFLIYKVSFSKEEFQKFKYFVVSLALPLKEINIFLKWTCSYSPLNFIILSSVRPRTMH